MMPRRNAHILLPLPSWNVHGMLVWKSEGRLKFTIGNTLLHFQISATISQKNYKAELTGT